MFRRNSIISICFALTSLASVHAEAGLCDWLFGRTNSPYVAGYAPYVAGYAPYGSGAYGLGAYGLNAPYTPNPYAASYPSVAIAGTTAPVNGVYQAQMRSYDNPSVYTGQPVVVNQALPQTAYRLPVSGTTAPLGVTTSNYITNYGSYYAGAGMFGRAPRTVPLAGLYRGPQTSSNPFYGTGNVYPRGNPAGVYQTNYPSVGIAGAPTVTPIPTGLPGSALPAAQVAPLFPAATEPRVGGLARFFGSLLGTNYRSSYYRAPITYYRPVTSVDPVSGTTVTVQQPCTSYVQQLQRTPYSSLQPGLIAPTISPAGGPDCGASGCQTTYPGYASAPTVALPSAVDSYGSVPSTIPSMSAIDQVGGYTSPNDRLVVPIPSTQQPGYYQQPGVGLNTAPLTGVGSGDRDPVDQPRLESARPSTEPDWWRRDEPANDESFHENTTEPSSYLKRIDLEDRTAANASTSHEPAQQVQAFSDARPIAAPEGFDNPFHRRTNDSSVTPVNHDELVAPPLPPPSVTPRYDRESYSASVRVSVPVREATQRQSAIRLGTPQPTVAQPKRDNTWYSSN